VKTHEEYLAALQPLVRELIELWLQLQEAAARLRETSEDLHEQLCSTDSGITSTGG